jgi:tetratricopeptide (TPR) repeat protein
MLAENKHYFFDVHEFEEILEYYLEKRDTKHASKVIEIGLQQHPTAWSLKIKHAQLYITQENPAKALKILNSLQNIDLLEEDVLVLKAHAYNQMGNEKEAIRYFDKVLKITEREEKEDMLISIGIFFQQNNQQQTAIKYFQQAYSENSESEDSLYHLGVSYERLSNFDKSIESYDKYLDIDPYSEIVWYKLGEVFEKTGDLDKAIESYDFSIALEEDFTLAYLNKAEAYIRQNQLGKAINVYYELLEVEEDFIEVYCNIGECYEDLNKFDQAIKAYKKAIQEDEYFAMPWLSIGRIKLEQNKPEEALVHLKKANEIEEDNDEIYFYLGEAYGMLKKKHKAEDAYEDAVNINPLNERYWYSFGEYLHSAGDIQKAIEVLERSLDYHHESIEIKYMLAGLYLCHKDYDNGIPILKECLRTDPFPFFILLDICPKALETKKIKNIIAPYMNQKIL